MAAARYWRLCQAVSYAGGDIVLTECALSDASGRVDGSAAITSTVAPVAGVLGALNDGSYGSAVQWAAADVAPPGWAIVWDLGAAYELVTFGVAGVSQDTFPLRCVVQSSTDGVAWSDWGSPEQYAVFPGPGADYVISIGIGAVLFQKTFNGTLIDAAAYGKIVGAPVIADGGTPERASVLSVRGSDWLVYPSAQPLGSADYTVEFWVYSRLGPSSNLGLCAVGSGTSNILLLTGWFLYQNAGAGLKLYQGSVKIASTANLGLQTWTHLAVVRASGIVTLYVNGVASGSFSGDTNSYVEGMSLGGPTQSGINALDGMIDDVRVTVGTARYTSNFSPPISLPATVEHAPLRVLHDAKLLTLDMADGGLFRIASTVSRLGVPGRYRVRLFDRRSGRCIRETWSAADGAYCFDGIAFRSAGYFVVGYDHSGTPVNASISDLLTPEPML